MQWVYKGSKDVEFAETIKDVREADSVNQISDIFDRQDIDDDDTSDDQMLFNTQCSQNQKSKRKNYQYIFFAEFVFKKNTHQK